MKLYCAIDLHSTNNYLAIIDSNMKRIFKKRLNNDPELILSVLSNYKEDLKGIVVESTFNWYWLVDALKEAGYSAHLANPSAMQKYFGKKRRDDKDEAFWLAELLCLGILPEGYIYPKEMRPTRDLLRKRVHLVKVRTALILSLQNIVHRNTNIRLKSNDFKTINEDKITPYLQEHEDLVFASQTSKDVIDYIRIKINKIENKVENKIKLTPPYKNLLTLPGVGKILAGTIMLETGSIRRFAKVGNYSSYCRKVDSKWTSNNKKKGKGNTKNGNRYLAWAYSEAAEHARGLHQGSKDFYNRKKKQTNLISAHNALAHKLARAAYYIMRDDVVFEEDKLFN